MKISPTVIDHFTSAAPAYDEKNQQLAPIADNMHFLIRLILNKAPAKARVLCIGVGTGAEVLSLSKTFPDWTFVGVDPSIGMLNVCREKLRSAGVLDRCELICGYVDDVPTGENFDVAMSIFVAHFVARKDRLSFYKAMFDRLRTNGFLVNTEISYDLSSKEFPLMLKNWESVQQLMGATPESLANLEQVLREGLTVVSPKEVEELLNECGINLPIHFFQSFMINGWYGLKSEQG